MYKQLALVPILFFSAVLFGANPVNEWKGTFLWAALISSLVLLPARLLLKDTDRWFKVLVHARLNSTSERLFWCGSVASLCGAWLGAFPILLDWNQSWQVWPLPSCIGAVIGSLVGYVGYSGLVYCYHSRRKQLTV